MLLSGVEKLDSEKIVVQFVGTNYDNLTQYHGKWLKPF